MPRTTITRKSPSGSPFYFVEEVSTVSFEALEERTGIDYTVTVVGAEVGDVVAWSPQEAPPEGLIFGRGRVISADQVELRVCNGIDTQVDVFDSPLNVAIFKPGKIQRLSPSGHQDIVTRAVLGVTFVGAPAKTAGLQTIAVSGAEVEDVVVWAPVGAMQNTRRVYGYGRVSEAGVVELAWDNVAAGFSMAATTENVVVALIKPVRNRRSPSGYKVAKSQDVGNAVISCQSNATNDVTITDVDASFYAGINNAYGLAIWSPEIDYVDRIHYGVAYLESSGPLVYRLANVGNASMANSTTRSSVVIIAPVTT